MPADELAQYATEAIRLGQLRYGFTSDTHHIPSEEAHVFRLDFHGSLPDKVLKAEKPGLWKVAREAVVFPHLASWGVPIPRLEATHADVADSAFRFLLMECVPGRHLETWPDAQTDFGEPLFRRMGSLIAGINSIPLDDMPADYDVTPYFDNWIKPFLTHTRHVLPADQR